MRWSCCPTEGKSAGSCNTLCGGVATLRRTTSGCGRRSWLTAWTGWPSTKLLPRAAGAPAGPPARRRFPWLRRQPPLWQITENFKYVVWLMPGSGWRRRPRC